MHQKVVISARQFCILVMLNTIGTTILIVPSGLAAEAKQDAWIPAILAICIGLLVIGLHNALGNLFPEMTFVEYCKKILGKWAGSILSIGLIYFSFIGASTLVWVMGNFLVSQIMPETPTDVIYIFFVVVVVYGLRLGLEPIARCAEIFLPWVILFFLLLVVLPIPEVDSKNLQPMFDTEPIPIIKGTLSFICVATMPLIVFQMIVPYGKRSKQTNRAFYIGNITGSFILLAITLLTILVLGAELTARNIFPSFVLAKKVTITGFLERIEVIMALLWFITIYFKTTSYCYACLKGLSQLLSLKEYRILTLPFGMSLIAFSMIVYPDVVYAGEWDTKTWIPYSLTYGLVIPLLLYIVALVRRKKLVR
ncbi:endospore germination permease [Neobacillus niacini]|uniref:GerAB/ArcD/ProY family transporter n=1 Tax=Neobacillus niacini TaxID=86668 RepID=UPI00300080B1